MSRTATQIITQGFDWDWKDRLFIKTHMIDIVPLAGDLHMGMWKVRLFCAVIAFLQKAN